MELNEKFKAPPLAKAMVCKSSTDGAVCLWRESFIARYFAFLGVWWCLHCNVDTVLVRK